MYLVDINGEQTKRIAKTYIIGKDSEVACGARYSPAFGSSGLRAAQHPKQGARSGTTGDRSVTPFRSLRQHERNLCRSGCPRNRLNPHPDKRR